MSLTKSKGNMYEWVGQRWNPLGGRCPHGCTYCWVRNVSPRVKHKYDGPLRLAEEVFKHDFGRGKPVFVCSCNDLFAEAIPTEFIMRILRYCRKHPENTFVFQTKNPERLVHYRHMLPKKPMLGTTIESNRHYPEIMRAAPQPVSRVMGMTRLRRYGPSGPSERLFITIEPILDFDLPEVADWLHRIRPEFVNIGADSKGHGLPEPSGEKVRALIAEIKRMGIEIRQKSNLNRLVAQK